MPPFVRRAAARFGLSGPDATLAATAPVRDTLSDPGLRQSARAAFAIGVCIALVLSAGHAIDAPPALVWAAALVLSTVCCWALGALPEPTATLLFFLCAVVFQIAPPKVVFSGFASPAWWLMFGGAVTGVALRNSGLALRLADAIFQRRVHGYPQLVALVAASSLYGINLSYGGYLLLHFPVLGLLKTVVLVWLVCRLFPHDAPLAAAPAAARAPMGRQERLLAVILAIAVVGFATDALHGISPAWIALAASIVCLLPGVGLVSSRALAEQVHLVPLLYVAGFLGLGAVVESTGLGTAVSHALLHWLQLAPGHTAVNVGALGAVGASMGLMTTLPSLPAVLSPLAREFASATGLPLETVLMLQVPVFSTVFFPYQSPPIVIAMQMGGVGLRHGTRLCLALAAITVVVLLPLDYLWWRLLGYLP